MKDVCVHDVAEVFIKSDDKLYFFGLTASNSVSQTMDTTPIRGGIGQKRVTSIMNNKAMSFNVQTTLHNPDLMEIQSGSLFTNGAIDVYKTESGQAVDETGSIVVVIEGTPVDGEVTVLDKLGKEVSGTYSTGKVTIALGQVGEYYNVIYLESQSNAEILDLNVESMPKICECQLHTIGYNPDTEEVQCDIYWNFLRCRSDGNFDLNYSADNMQDSIKFDAEVPLGGKSFGSYVVVPR